MFKFHVFCLFLFFYQSFAELRLKTKKSRKKYFENKSYAIHPKTEMMTDLILAADELEMILKSYGKHKQVFIAAGVK